MLQPANAAFRDGIPYCDAFGDVYHSAAGGPAQAAHVFLAGNGLPARWQGRGRFTILETGFGFGLNFLVTWQAWKRDPQRCARLHYVAIEKHPFSLSDLKLLHEKYPDLRDEAAELHSAWPLLVSGGHRAELGPVTLTLFFADVKIARDLRLAADALYLDGFAPDRNPDMWTPQVMRSLSRLAARECTVATWSVAASVRRALEQTGFAVDKQPGFGPKREMLAGSIIKGIDPVLPKTRTISVVGAGLAGAAVCERLCARGWDVTLYERHAEPAAEASGNHAGTFHPIVTPDDSKFARITRAGYLYGISRWKNLAGVRWDPCGVLQLARDEKEDGSQRKSVAGLPPGYAQYVSREEASGHAGVPVAAGGVWFPQGGWIQPRTLVAAQLAACGPRLERRFGKELKAMPEGIVILANSGEALNLHPVPDLRLRRVRGQLTYVPEDRLEAPRVVVLRGGLVLPPVEGKVVIGASYDIDDDDAQPSADSETGNLERLERILGISVSGKFENRVAFRSVAPDRLPVIGKIADNVYGAFAYGSRGLVWAALAAEIIACELEGEPLPVEGTLADALRPGRFALRAGRRLGGLQAREEPDG